MPFPIPFVPKPAYSGAKAFGRAFGASRDGGQRKHAGCDLIAPLGTTVVAVADGKVVEFSPRFFNGTAAVGILHPSLPGLTGRDYVVRYCEVLDARHDPEYFGRLRKHMQVSAGQTIAKVGKMKVHSMLHFELYSGTLQNRGRLTQDKGEFCNKEFKRRKDVIDPTSLLDELAKDLVMVFTLEETGQV